MQSLLDEEAGAPPQYLATGRDGAIRLTQPAAPPPAAPPPTKISAHPRPPKKRDTAGEGWGHMSAPQLTTEVKRELLVVKMRSAIDPKRFYRSSDHKKGLPKYFQIGTVVDGGEAGQVTKKQQRKSMLAELMGDHNVRRRAKSQHLKVQAAAMEGTRRGGTKKQIRKAGKRG